MAAIFTLRKGSSNASSPSLTEAELYLHLGSGSIQFGSGSTQYNLLPLNAPAYGDINLIGNITASGDVRIGGNIYLGNATADNISALGQFNTNLVPNGTIDIGTVSAPWTNVYANSISASNIIGTIGGVDVSLLSTRVSQLAAGTASVNTHTASVNGHITDINVKTGSFEAKFSTLETYTASVNGHITDINLWTASVNTNNTARFQRIEESTSSLNSFSASQLIKDSTLQTYTASVDAKFAAIQASTSSINSFTASNDNTSLNSYTASNDTTNTNQNNRLTRLEESTASLNEFSSSENTKSETLRLYTASIDTKFTTLQTYTASVDSTIARLIESTASLNIFSQSIHQYTSSTNQRLSALETQSGSDVSRLNNIESYTSSLKTAIGVSGADVTINGNLSVLGTTTQINSTQVNIGENILELNYGGSATVAGLYTKDATGGSTTSGSLLWDSTNDYWKAGKINAETKILLAGGDSVVTSSAQVVGILQYLNEFSASQESKDVIIASYTSSMNNHTASVNGHIADINIKTGSFETKFDNIQASTSSLNTFSASALTRLSRIEESTASINVYTASINAFTASQLQKDSTLQTVTASLNNATASLYSYTASLNTFSASQYVSNSYFATTGSNNFVGNQSITGNISLTGSIIPSGSASFDLGSQQHPFRHLYVGSGSLFVGGEKIIGDNNVIIPANYDLIFRGSGSTYPYSGQGDLVYQRSDGSERARFWLSDDADRFVVAFNGDHYNWKTIIHSGNLKEFGSSSFVLTSSLNAYTASNDTTNNTQNNRLSRLEESTASLNTFSASINGHVADTNSWSASVKVHIVDINEWTGSQKQKDTTLENVTASLNLQTASFNTWTGSVFQPFSTSVDNRLDSLEYTVTILSPGGLEASLLSINSATQSLQVFSQSIHQYTASLNDTVARLKESTASLNLFTQSYSTHSSSFDARLDVLEAYSSSQIVPTASLAERATQVDILVKNVSGAQIDKGKVVRISGATGDNPLIVTASFLTEGQSANTLGITTQNIPNDSFGYVVTEGVLLGVDTTGMTAGQLIYLGANGTFTTTPPTAPNHGVRLGEVLRDQQNNGSIYVRVDNGSELGEAHDVVDSTTNSSYGDFLMKSGSVWINNSTFSASVNGHILDINAYTASNNTTNTSQNNRLTRLEESTSSINSYTASLKTAITIAGSDVTVNGNLTVAGTTTTINSTTVNIGDNIIQLNGTGATNGGLVVRDATAATTTSGSLLWDTANDRWIAGPLGAEAKVLTDGMGVVSGSFLSLLPAGVVSGSSQVNFTQLSGISSNIVSASSDTSNVDITISNGSISANLFGGVVSGSAQVIGMLASLNTYTGSNDTTNTTQNNRLTRIEESTSSLNSFSASENTKSETLRLYTASIDTKFNTLQSYTASIDSTIARLRESTASLNLYTQSNDTTNATQNTRLSRIEESTSSLNTLTASLATTYEGRASATKVLVSGSSQVNFTQLSGISANIISGSTNSTNVNFTISGGSITANLIGGVVSGSSQVNFTQLSGISNGIVSGAAQVTPLLPTGTVSGSSQVYSGVSGDITIAANGVATIANNSVLLGTDTIGDYVAYLVQGTGVTITNNSGEGSTPTITIGQAVATSSNVQFNSIGVGMAASATAGRIDATNDIVAFSSSDKRFKDNIKPIENALEKIESVGGYEFDWKEENKIEHGYDGHDIGVIAQEIEAIAPELVQTRENGYKAVKYDKIVPLLIEAIKELSAKVKELENK